MPQVERRSEAADTQDADQAGSWPALAAALLVLVLVVALVVFFKLHLFEGGASNTITT